MRRILLIILLLINISAISQKIGMPGPIHHIYKSYANSSEILYADSDSIILRIIETTSSRLNSWSWQKRWSDRDEGYGYKK